MRQQPNKSPVPTAVGNRSYSRVPLDGFVVIEPPIKSTDRQKCDTTKCHNDSKNPVPAIKGTNGCCCAEQHPVAIYFFVFFAHKSFGVRESPVAGGSSGTLDGSATVFVLSNDSRILAMRFLRSVSRLMSAHESVTDRFSAFSAAIRILISMRVLCRSYLFRAWKFGAWTSWVAPDRICLFALFIFVCRCSSRLTSRRSQPRLALSDCSRELMVV